MGWVSWMEQRRRFLIVGVSSICLGSLFAVSTRRLIGFDAYWHLKMGKDWVEKGLSPWIDHLSFTFSGAEIHPVPALFQATLYWFVSSFGDVLGPLLLRFAAFALVFGLTLIYLRQVKAPVLVYCLVLPFVTAMMEFRVVVRPELFVYPLCVVALMLYRYRDGELSARTMIPIAILMAFWNNYHAPVFGYVIFFGYFVDAGVRQLQSRASLSQWLNWFVWGVLVVALGFLVPGFEHPIIRQIQLDPEWTRIIQEYQSPFVYKRVIALYAVPLVALATLALAVRQRRYGYIAILIVLGCSALLMIRMVTPAGLVFACMLAHMISASNWESWLRAKQSFAQAALGFVAVAIVLLSTWSMVEIPHIYLRENSKLQEVYPRDVIAHMRENRLHGHIFNDFKIGGFLSYALSSASKTYIDGRTHILFPIEHAKRYGSAETSAEVLAEEVAKYDIAFAILENRPENYRLADDTGLLKLDFVGSGYSLFARDSSRLPLIGRLLARPTCWRDLSIEDLRTELKLAVSVLNPDSTALPFVNLVAGFANSNDGVSYLRSVAGSRTWTDTEMRFAAFRSLEAGADELAVQFLNSLRNKELNDYIAGAFAMVQLGRLDDAENILKFTSESSWSYVAIEDVVLIQALLDEISSQRPLKTITPGFVEYVQQTLDQYKLTDSAHSFEHDGFCVSLGT